MPRPSCPPRRIRPDPPYQCARCALSYGERECDMSTIGSGTGHRTTRRRRRDRPTSRGAAGSSSGSSATCRPRSSAPPRWSWRASAVTIWTDTPALIAIAALARRDRRLLRRARGHDLRRAAAGRRRLARARSAAPFLLLVAEFGVAELLDTLLIRPAALIARRVAAARSDVGASRRQGRRRRHLLRHRGRRIHRHRQDRTARRPSLRERAS